MESASRILLAYLLNMKKVGGKNVLFLKNSKSIVFQSGGTVKMMNAGRELRCGHGKRNNEQ